MGKSQTVTTGYKYFFDIQMGLARTLDSILTILVGDIQLFNGEIDGSGSGTFDSDNLFGGDKGEGGIVGSWQAFDGNPSQTYPDGIKALLGGLVPDFRGLHTFYYSGQVCSNNPYPKAWKFRVVRNKAGWVNGSTAWYPDKAEIVIPGTSDENGSIRAMNPAHIIYQCATDPDWGRGLDPSLIDEPSFIDAANTLCSEGFGLCLPWNRQNDLNDFVQTIVNHIGASIFTDRRTGLLSMRLIRGDYVPGDLPLFDATSGLIDIQDSDSSSSNVIDEVIVQYINPLDKGNQGQARAQNLASILSNGGAVNSTTTSYPGLPSFDLAQRIALRDLRVAAGGLQTFNLTFDRRAWKIYPGMPFRISAPERGIAEMIVRAGTVKDSTLTDGKISIGAAQDVFGMPATSYQTAEVSGWVPPARQPLRIDNRLVGETTYRDLVRELSSGDLAAFPETSGAIIILAAKPNGSTINYVVASATDGVTFAEHGNDDFTGYTTLIGDIGAYDTAITFDVLHNVNPVKVGAGVQIGNEFLRIDGISGTTLTLARGCVDTLPKKHFNGDTIWFSDAPVGTDNQEYSLSEVVSVKLLSKTLSAELNIGIADADNITIVARQNMPIVPGNMRIAWTDEFGTDQDQPAIDFAGYTLGEFTFNWATRNRLTELDQLIDHQEAAITPESGQTVTIYIYDAPTSTLLDTITGITGDTWTYTTGEDTSIGSPQFILFKIVAARDGIESWDAYNIRMPRGPGWGNDWGFDWNN